MPHRWRSQLGVPDLRPRPCRPPQSSAVPTAPSTRWPLRLSAGVSPLLATLRTWLSAVAFPAAAPTRIHPGCALGSQRTCRSATIATLVFLRWLDRPLLRNADVRIRRHLRLRRRLGSLVRSQKQIERDVGAELIVGARLFRSHERLGTRLDLTERFSRPLSRYTADRQPRCHRITSRQCQSRASPTFLHAPDSARGICCVCCGAGRATNLLDVLAGQVRRQVSIRDPRTNVCEPRRRIGNLGRGCQIELALFHQRQCFRQPGVQGSRRRDELGSVFVGKVQRLLQIFLKALRITSPSIQRGNATHVNHFQPCDGSGRGTNNAHDRVVGQALDTFCQPVLSSGEDTCDHLQGFVSCQVSQNRRGGHASDDRNRHRQKPRIRASPNRVILYCPEKSLISKQNLR